jgi:hypothetical protein
MVTQSTWHKGEYGDTILLPQTGTIREKEEHGRISDTCFTLNTLISTGRQ